MAEIEINAAALEAARRMVENVLVDHRDSGIFMVGGNGFVCRDKDGTDSYILRMSTAMGLQVGIKAYLAALTAQEQCPHCTSPYRDHRFAMPTAEGWAHCSDSWHDQGDSATETGGGLDA